ncbi:hypothetical protein, partial [Bacillus mycoides]|uniref:hypothetical protein n=1 Tax=Bacillus mycoides TaxID=1405 RepID=UPI0019D628B1
PFRGLGKETQIKKYMQYIKRRFQKSILSPKIMGLFVETLLQEYIEVLRICKKTPGIYLIGVLKIRAI